MNNNKLAIITVVYENYTVLDDFLASLRNQTNKNYYLYCIDVSIHRYTINLKGIPAETVYAENKGYSHGVNIGLKKAIANNFEHFCIMNNDVYFKEDFTKNALDTILKYPSSIIAGKIYYAPTFEYHKDRYKKSDSGKVIWYAGGYIDQDHALTPHIGVDEIDHGQFDSFKEIEFVNGALMVYDKSVIDKVGFWNESYFLYFEDADFCVRAKRAGVKIYYDPKTIIWHKNAQSTGGSGSQIHQEYQRINRLRFGLKYAPLRTKLHLIKNYLLESITSLRGTQ
ncbi:hypothetical protein A3A46_03225 [Candidatus Roizmanbacteria bacterium RIFCSPLOWO2_01_FULL_37_13]|uniref:Glycosyltransferase 2-like domain-containing protein n=1 Tax=Candidatus Roizmanbacteria bacterium RIFCSPHIGHO2_02_FULL_38_11 TaxID=1802039 RepID=A0A1F7GY41_9BACT|nr:MAG: hypothetical protein A3C25_02060 [Candidatus Roizmanbacteria bacterium RIFCSPHIGHO2_02_FULL_38_11]OGK33256.1 MAG: hypothetical protein A3F58_03585 [Candidatus Roizmanbacteria bacterium RIFCSPHIGHO2_12_FULL_37_9b]OGK43143.1 MAG: hypothetical protein A3A46_03225 [Candidatus Roizmanbacteria bacterium RIFCSPLOWO2_01_FULL_37_13]